MEMGPPCGAVRGAMINPADQAPIVVLTGFLGAGKSTLLQALLSQPEFADTGLVINEFGDVAIDHELLAAGVTDVAVTSTGCICCTAGADVRASIAQVHEAARQMGRLPLPRIVVETTGLADPAPVVNQLVAGAVPAFGLRDHTVARHYRLAGVVSVFDVVDGPAALKAHPESVKQIAFADRIVLTKSDLLAPDEQDARVSEVTALLRQINPTATVLSVEAARRAIGAVFAPRPYAPRDLGVNVESWLQAAAHAHHDHHHHEHGDDGGFGVRSASIVLDAPVDKGALAHAMDLIQMLYGPQLLRLKGIVSFADDTEAPYVLQVVQHVVHPLARLAAWPSADRRTRIVVITQGIDPRQIEDMLRAQLATAPLNA